MVALKQFVQVVKVFKHRLFIQFSTDLWKVHFLKKWSSSIFFPIIEYVCHCIRTTGFYGWLLVAMVHKRSYGGRGICCL